MLLSYWTVPYVQLRDRKLQLFYNVGMAGVFVYVFLSIFKEQGYLELDDIEGFGRPTVRLRARAPPAPFCETLRCEDIDADQAAVELGTEEVFVTTMARKLTQESDCPTGHKGDCNKFRTTNVSSYFVQSAENFEVRITHNIYCSKFLQSCADMKQCQYAAAGKSMAGTLLGTDGRVLKQIPAGTIPRYELKEWLEAAGIGLDDVSDAAHDDDNAYVGVNDKQIPTYRFLGMVLLVDVRYHGKTGSFLDYVRGNSPMTYEIRVNHIPHTLYKHREILNVQHSAGTGLSSRELLRSAGIVIRVSQSGSCARFSYSSMLEKFLVNIGLIGVLTSIIEFVWQFVYPLWGIDYNAKVYREVNEAEVEKDSKTKQEKEIKSD